VRRSSFNLYTHPERLRHEVEPSAS
jgi:hypothetical protein